MKQIKYNTLFFPLASMVLLAFLVLLAFMLALLASLVLLAFLLALLASLVLLAFLLSFPDLPWYTWPSFSRL